MRKTSGLFIAVLLSACGNPEPASPTHAPQAQPAAPAPADPLAEANVQNAVDPSGENINYTNASILYKNSLGHELRLEIMGKNHETLWFYSEGDGEVQIIPVIGANDTYAMTTNEGQHLGTMQLQDISSEGGFDIPGKIEVSAGSNKTLFTQVAVND